MKTFAVHSPNDAALLIRLHDDLVKSLLFSSDRQWNRYHNPLSETPRTCLYVPYDSDLIYIVGCVAPSNAAGRDLTPSNYDAILSEIIESRS